MFYQQFRFLFPAFLFFALFSTVGHAQSGLSILDSKEKKVANVLEEPFTPVNDAAIGAQVGNHYWIKMPLSTDDIDKLFVLQTSSLDTVEYFLINAGGKITEQGITGDQFKYSTREIKHPDIAVNLSEFEEGTVLFLRVSNSQPIAYNVSLERTGSVIERLSQVNLVKGVYFGIMLVMFLYNLFIFTFTKDRSYFYYAHYILFFGFAQYCLEGYAQIWPFQNYPGIFNSSSLYASSFAGIFAILFAIKFLDLKTNAPKLRTPFYFFLVLYGSIVPIEFLGFSEVSTAILNLNGISIGFYTLSVAIYLASKGLRTAKFYAIAWTFFLICLFLYVLRNFDLIPVNSFTNNILLVGSATEVVLLSLALADRINILRKEKEASQAEALRAAQEKEQMIKRQNIELEQRVSERTEELQESNEELRVTLDNLKETQSQLVESEKMASLGQLTAGIAHEINNPINFVTSNITPLRRDLEDVYEIMDAYTKIDPEQFKTQFELANNLKEELEYDYLKTEINSLVDGVSEGANRTKEIVNGLRTFSRLDEDAVKQADLHENLRSTLVLLNNKLDSGIEIEYDFDEHVRDIECYPGKLNQVFMNILNNAIYAVQHKKYENNEQAKITIKTAKEGENVTVIISDNGIGMSAETQRKIFEPFFTTKDVGEGTGLGMSIVFKIVEKHSGELSVTSTLGEGTQFKLHLPISQPSEFQ